MKLEKLSFFEFLTFAEKKIVLPVFGVFFLIVGVIGLFIPIVPGVAFIILGLALVGNKTLKKVVQEKILKNKASEKT